MKKYIKILSYLLLILFLLELSFQIVYLLTNNHYLENKYQTEAYFYKSQSIKNYQENIFRKNYKIKIGTFGGSSTYGYSSQINFSSILKNYFYYTDKDIQVVNYGSPSLPFAGYVSKLIKNEMHKYDIIIIYAGHNEWETEPYNVEYFDNGFPHPLKFAELDKSFNNTISKLIERNKSNIMTGGYKIFNKYTSYSRLTNFLFRTYDKIRTIINTQKNKNYRKKIEKN